MNVDLITKTAASVRGARAAGIETLAASSAQSVLAAAELELDRLQQAVVAAEPSAPDQTDEARYYALAVKADRFAEAVADLRDALGIAAPATPTPAPAHIPRPAADSAASREAAEAAAKAALATEAWAAEFVASLPRTADRFGGECYDTRGLRVALIHRYRLTESRSSILGYSPGGEVCDEEFFLAAEDGRRLQRGEFVAVRGGWDRCYMGGNELRICGMNAVPSPEITADWIPTAAAEPRMFPCNRSPDRFYGEAELVGWWQAALEDAEKSAEAARLDAARAARAARAAASDAAHRAANNPFAALNALRTR